MMEALKESNINGIKDFPMIGGPEIQNNLRRKKKYYLESSHGDVKD